MANIELKLSDIVKIELDFKERITLVGGDSATGKTFFVDALKDMILNPDTVEGKNLPSDGINKFVVCSSEVEVSNIFDKHNKIIVIDRWDIYSKEAKAKVIKKISEQDNTWIIMTRVMDIPNYGFSRRSIVKVESTKVNGLITLRLVPLYP